MAPETEAKQEQSTIDGFIGEAIAAAKKSCAEFRNRAKANALPGQKPPKLTAALVEKLVRQALEPHRDAIVAAAVAKVSASITPDPE